jgi:fibronectin type 3 domain-containing protein
MHRILALLTLAALFALTASGCSDSASSSSAPDEDLTPPAAPVNLSLSVKGDQVTVAWSENSEVDLASYRVYRSVNERDLALASDCDHARYVDTIEESGLLALTYRVTAVDANDNESALSAIVEIVVDTAEPIIAEQLDQ